VGFDCVYVSGWRDGGSVVAEVAIMGKLFTTVALTLLNALALIGLYALGNSEIEIVVRSFCVFILGFQAFSFVRIVVWQ
jgi:hypothetical protein